MIHQPRYYGVRQKFKLSLCFHPKLSAKQHLFAYILIIQVLFVFVFLYFHLLCPLLVMFNQRVIESRFWLTSDKLTIVEKDINGNSVLVTSPNRIAFVFTHPDDESMFFTPAIRRLLRDDKDIYMLCFTTNFKKFMSSPTENRALELERAANVLGLGGDFKILDINNKEDESVYGRVTVVGLPGTEEDWFLTEEDMQAILATFLKKYDIETVITFDKYGVSGHPEHFKARTAVLKYKESVNIPVFELITYPKIIKFSGIFGAYLLRGSNTVLYTDGVEYAWNAMVEHGSQWTWFRKFFIANSRYAYVNNLRRI